MRRAAAAVILIWVGAVMAGVNPETSELGRFSCELEVGYFDTESGPLCRPNDPQGVAAEGCVIKLYEDTDRDGTASSADCEIAVISPDLHIDDFTVNGSALFGIPGTFFLRARFVVKSSAPVYFRVFDSGEAAQTEGYWESPLYSLLPGNQQISFRRSELTYQAGRLKPTQGPHESASPTLATQQVSDARRLVPYPNPFNSSTAIAFELQAAASVRIRVHDLHGRFVRNLADHPYESGSHQVRFDADDLPSGTYLISLEKNGHLMNAQRVMLIK